MQWVQYITLHYNKKGDDVNNDDDDDDDKNYVIKWRRGILKINSLVFGPNSPFHGSWKVTKLLHETEAKVILAQLEKWE